MANNDFTRFSKRVVQYFWDPLPRNEDPSQIWCLGRSYDSRYHHSRASLQSGSSPPARSDSSGTSQADSGVDTEPHSQDVDPAQPNDDLTSKSHAELSRAEEEALGWPSEFLDDLESRIWLTYRSNFPPILKSSDPAATSAMSFSTKLRNLTNPSAFTSDTGWGCMIRSGQSMLANTLAVLQLGREWRLGQREQEHKALLELFADAPEAPFSIHKFVEHGAQACGKHPGEWFGPSATANCIQ
jgi:cysteine protease ATG4